MGGGEATSFCLTAPGYLSLVVGLRPKVPGSLSHSGAISLPGSLPSVLAWHARASCAVSPLCLAVIPHGSCRCLHGPRSTTSLRPLGGPSAHERPHLGPLGWGPCPSSC